ncbi:MAG: DUF6268 family outer membrane beta-barrel protein [Saprospiraceae bacterium]
MSRYLLLILLAALILKANLLKAQIAPNFLVEDAIDTESLIGVDCDWCKPGLKNKSRSRGLDIAYQALGNSFFEETETPLKRPFPELDHLGLLILKIKIPLILKDDFKLLVGASYRPEYYDIGNFTGNFEPEFAQIDGETMKSTAFQVLATKALNEYSYLTLRLKTKFNGDYEGFVNFNKRYGIYTLSGMYGVKKSELLEWGVGLTINSSFRNRFIALPVFLYNRNFNQKWGIELFLPAIAKVRYNLSPKTILLAGINFSSRNYRINVERPFDTTDFVMADYVLRHSEIQMGIELEQKIVPWIWVNARVGYQTNFRTSFEAKNEFARSFEVEPTDAPFIRLGIFISPPDKMME